MSWHFTLEKIGARVKELKSAMVRARQPLGEFRMRRTGDSAVIAPDYDDRSWETLPANGKYFAREETVILRQTLTVPEGWSGLRAFLALELLEAETLVYIDGKPKQAIDLFHHELLLADHAHPGREFAVALDAYTGIPGPRPDRVAASVSEHPTEVSIKTAELQGIDRETEALYYDLMVAHDANKTLDPNSREYQTLLRITDETVNLLDFRTGLDDRFYESVVKARAHLQDNLYKKLHADPDFSPTLWATGHAHIDTAWLWRLAHTRKKIGRTFSTALTLMEEFPDYKFSVSQPQQYAYLEEDYPTIFASVKKAIADGRWEPHGGMWVETDCNVVSGESLVRQLFYGQRYFKKQFGTHSDVVWLPDVFGYSASFPQIIKKSGMKYFMTIKIFWNQINKPPYQTFDWEGIDGTSVLVHFSPLGDYNAVFTPAQLQRTWNEYKQKNVSDSSLYIYGYGDGGGGPTRQMLEVAKRVTDFPGVPKVKLTTNQEFFEDLERQVAGNPELPRWVGELYLELHRGTYTTQARNKRFNRQSEFLLQSAEQVSALALLLTGAAYPQDALTTAWEMTLLNQFHDIIPGSSIGQVYEDSTKDYEHILATGKEAAGSALRTIANDVKADSGDVVVYNPLSWSRSDVIEIPRSWGLAGQEAVDPDANEVTLIAPTALPAIGYTTIRPGAATAGSARELSVSTEVLENDFFRIALDKNAEIASVWDKRVGREVIDANSYCKGNALLSFEDKPMNWEAWDVDIFYNEKLTPVKDVTSLRVLESGTLRGVVEIRRTFGRGTVVTQRMTVYRDTPRIDFVTDVDWKERQTLLKAAFPVAIHSPRATYDIQFGNVERPTHWNTSWDWARFEVCGQKWADLSEANYGVSVLSDSKYGWDIKGNVMRLSLLRGPISPDANADLGRQRFTYSLFPHLGDWRTGGTVQASYELNVPVQLARASGGGSLPSEYSLVRPDAPNLILETVKKAEDDDELVVRLFEAYGQRGKGTLTFGQAIQSAVEVNLLEEETAETKAEDLTVAGPAISFSFKPYEIKTFKVRLK